MSIKIVNMTPHDVVVLDADNKVIRTFEKSGRTIRLEAKVWTADKIDGVPTSVTRFGEPEGLPEYLGYQSHFGDDIYNRIMDGKPLIYYIVSQLVKSALPERDDLLVPAEVVRDDKGVILGCRSLGR